MKRMIDDSVLTDIADAIREKNGTDNKYEDVEMAQAIRDIPSPKEEQEKTVDITENGTTEILPDEGKVLSKVSVNTNVADSYYDIFWDAYQQNGERTDYELAFSNGNFNKLNFQPKYDIVPSKMQNMFASFPDECDLKEILASHGVELDLSNGTGNYVFNRSKFTALPILVSQGGIYQWFSNCKSLHTIEKMVFKEITKDYLNGFGGCTALQNITIEGEIGGTFNIKDSPLTVASAISIITHLVNYTGTENEFAYSVLFADSVWELLNAEGATAPGNITWEEYVNSIGWNK